VGTAWLNIVSVCIKHANQWCVVVNTLSAEMYEDGPVILGLAGLAEEQALRLLSAGWYKVIACCRC